MPRFHRLLVPHDLSDHADHALAVASELAGPKGELVVLHALMPIVPTTDAALALQLPIDQMMMDAKHHLDRVVARRVGSDGPKTTIKVVLGDAHRSIMDHARGCDAIVMSTRGRSGLAHLLMGSVAEKTVRHSDIPVLTLRPRIARRRARSRTTGSRQRAA